MVRFVIYSVLVITALASFVMAFVFGSEIAISKQIEIYVSLRGVATVIFGVMGAWLAIVYPDSLKKVLSKRQVVESVNANLKRVFFPMRVATLIVICTLVIEWISPILHRIDFLLSHTPLIRIGSFVLLTAFVLLLLWSLILTLLPMEQAEREVDVMGKFLDQAERKRGRTKKRQPPL